MSRELHNLAILRKDPNAAKIPWDKITDWNYTVGEGIGAQNDEAPANHVPKLLHIDKEDLEADEDSYEYSSSALDTSTFERAQIPGDEEMLLLGFGRASSPSTLRESPSYTIVESPSSMTMIGPSPSTVREPSPSTAREHSLSTFQEGPTARPSSSALPTPGYLPSNDPTSCKIQLGRLVSLEETLSRFEDVKYKAASYTEEWGLEDALRAERFNAVYPQTRQGKCCCTTEHRLYHYHLDALFNPIQQLHIESLLRSEMWKSDIQRDNQTTATSNRQEEVNTLLGTFDGHIDAQVRDLQAVQGSKGRLTGLAEYLRRYDGRKDLRSPEDLNRVSAAGKMELLGHVDAMLERWREDDEGVASLE